MAQVGGGGMLGGALLGGQGYGAGSPVPRLGASSVPKSPWQQNVTASLNGSPVAFASPGAPNVNYPTSDAVGALAKMLGAKVVQQNMTGMASPGSGAPSSPLQGLDFGIGDIQDPGMGIVQQERGDPDWLIQQRYQAGIAPNSYPGAQPGVPQDWGWHGVTPRTATSPTGVGIGAQAAAASRPAWQPPSATTAAITPNSGVLSGPDTGYVGSPPAVGNKANLIKALMMMFGGGGG